MSSPPIGATLPATRWGGVPPCVSCWPAPPAPSAARPFPVLAAAGHEVVGLARTPARLPDAEAVAADALDPAAVQRAVLAAAPDVIVHMLTAIPDPADPRHLARDMAPTNRLRTQGTANLLAAADGARVIVQGVAYAYDPAGSPVKYEDAPLWRDPPTQFAPDGAASPGGSAPAGSR